MKKSRLISLVIIGAVVILAGFLSSPLFANAPGDDGTAGASWAEMHQACASGDWAAMEEAAAEAHSGDYADMPCSDGNGPGMDGDMMPSGSY